MNGSVAKAAVPTFPGKRRSPCALSSALGHPEGAGQTQASCPVALPSEPCWGQRFGPHSCLLTCSVSPTVLGALRVTVKPAGDVRVRIGLHSFM